MVASVLEFEGALTVDQSAGTNGNSASPNSGATATTGTASELITKDTHYQTFSPFFCESQEAQVTGVKNVEYSSDQDN